MSDVFVVTDSGFCLEGVFQTYTGATASLRSKNSKAMAVHETSLEFEEGQDKWVLPNGAETHYYYIDRTPLLP